MGASDFLSTLHFVLNEDLECGTAVRARYSRKVAPVGVEMVECGTWNVEQQLGHDTLAKLHLPVSQSRASAEKYYSRGLLNSCVSRLCDHGVAAF